eukprot:1956665-Rhodomonas_salina.1
MSQKLQTSSHPRMPGITASTACAPSPSVVYIHDRNPSPAHPVNHPDRAVRQNRITNHSPGERRVRVPVRQRGGTPTPDNHRRGLDRRCQRKRP